jgi:hypothetical protein
VHLRAFFGPNIADIRGSLRSVAWRTNRKMNESEVSRRELRQLKWLTALASGTVVLIYEYARRARAHRSGPRAV